MGVRDFFYRFKGGGGEWNSGRSDKNQCRGTKSGRF